MTRDRRSAAQQSPSFVWDARDPQAQVPAAVPEGDDADAAAGTADAERDRRGGRLTRGASGRALIAAAVLVPLAGGTYALLAYSGQHADTAVAAARVSQVPDAAASPGPNPTDGSNPGPGPGPAGDPSQSPSGKPSPSPSPKASGTAANGSPPQAPSRVVTVEATPGRTVAGSTPVPTAAAPHTAVPATVAGPATGQIVGYQGLCLDDRGAGVTDYNPVQVFTCNGTDAQQWTPGPNDTVEVFGMCLDVYAAGTTGGTRVDLYQCNGTNAQTWVPQSDGALVNPESGQCLDDTEFGGSGTQVEIWTCNGGSDQVWRLP